jgi:hypothetical protein
MHLVRVIRSTTARMAARMLRKPCKIWEGLLFENGYGRITSGPNRGKRIHRVVWEEEYGPIPRGLMVLHQCDRPACYEITHLKLGTHKQNMQDRVDRLTGSRGIKTNTAKLSEEEVYEIRSLSDDGLSSRKIAPMFGISQVMVCLIARRKSWRHLPEKVLP